VAVRATPSPIAAQRRERVRAMMREDILGAARTILQDQGYKELSMRALGRAAGITAPTIYDYFPAKEAVLDALFAEGVDKLAEFLGGAAAAVEPGLPRVYAVGSAYRLFAINNPDLFLLLFGGVDPGYRPSESAVSRLMKVSDLAAEVVREAMDLGDLRSASAHEVSDSLWVMAHGCVMLEMNCFGWKFDAPAGEAFYLRNLGKLIEGLKNPSESRQQDAE
jgi:AcrR family transcriptional regulator